MTRTVPLAKFKENCAELVEAVEKNRDKVLVERDGRVVAELVPHLRTLEEMRGSVTFLGDIVAPLDEPWKRTSDRCRHARAHDQGRPNVVETIW
jgi:antitoxin (DNA-binding transcriptional repressor) of toxin-antitoxin stability system